MLLCKLMSRLHAMMLKSNWMSKNDHKQQFLSVYMEDADI